MSALSKSVVVDFCELCGWAYQCWLNHRELFDENLRAEELQKSSAREALARLSVISQEYSLLQVAKLHDHAVVSGKVTLSIDYVVSYGGWSVSVRQQLEELKGKLDVLGSQLRGARNKSLSHNDLSAVLSRSPLGVFQKGDDEIYFQHLQEFVDIVHGEIVGGPWPFDELVKTDVAKLLAMLKR